MNLLKEKRTKELMIDMEMKNKKIEEVNKKIEVMIEREKDKEAVMNELRERNI